MSDPHARILAAIEQGEARIATMPDHYEEWARAKAEQVRRYAHYRRILRRHQPTTAAAFPGATYCAGCSTIDHDERVVALVLLSRCRELPDLADALGVQP